MTGVEIVETVGVREEVPVRSFEPQEDLPGGGLSPGTMHDLHLPSLDEVVALHDRIHAFDVVTDIQNASAVGRIESDAVMLVIDREIGDKPDTMLRMSAEISGHTLRGLLFQFQSGCRYARPTPTAARSGARLETSADDMPSWSGIPGTNDPMRGRIDHENAPLAR